MSGYIYKITNTINNKCYIGQTIQDPKKRWYRHKWNSFNEKRCFKLHNSIKKNGVENFTFEIIYECDKRFLNHFEKNFISEYNSYNNGYNLTSGGDSNYTVSEKTRDKIRKANIGKTLNKKHKQALITSRIDTNNTIKHNKKISKAHIGKINGPLDQEHKNKLSNSLKGKTLIKNNITSKYNIDEKRVLKLINQPYLPSNIYFNKSKGEIIGFMFDNKINGKKIKRRFTDRNNLPLMYEKAIEIKRQYE